MVVMVEGKQLEGIDEKDWQIFWSMTRITEKQKIAFLATMINGGLQEILYNDPKLLRQIANFEPSV